MPNSEYSNALEQLNNYLAQHNLRRTQERTAILAYIFTKEGHFTAQSLHSELSKDFNVSLSTVYNNLELFTKLNFIVRHQFTSERVEYERFSSNQTHHHRICTICGNVKEFSDQKINKAITNRTFSSFETSHYSLYVYGICKKCQKKLNAKKRI